MIAAAALLLLAAVDDPSPLGTLPRQALDRGSCAAFLWEVTEPPRLVLMLRAGSGAARAMFSGAVRDLAQAAASGEAVRGIAPKARYGTDGSALDVDLVIEERSGLADGAVIPSGTVNMQRPGGDTVVMPVSGMIACRR